MPALGGAALRAWPLLCAPAALQAGCNQTLSCHWVQPFNGTLMFVPLQGCRGPVTGVVAEHWAAYFYWNAEERRHQVNPKYKTDRNTETPDSFSLGGGDIRQVRP